MISLILNVRKQASVKPYRLDSIVGVQYEYDMAWRSSI